MSDTNQSTASYHSACDNLLAIYTANTQNGKLIIRRRDALPLDEVVDVSRATIEALTADLMEHVVPLEVARIRKNDDAVNAMMSKGILVGSNYGESTEICIVGNLHFQNLQFIDIILSAIEVNLGYKDSTVLRLGSFFKRSQSRTSVVMHGVTVDRFDLRSEAIQVVDIVNSTIHQLDAFPPNVTALSIGVKFTMGVGMSSLTCSTHGRYTGAMFRAIQSHLDSSTGVLRRVTIRTLTDGPEVYHSLIGFMKFVNMCELYIVVIDKVTNDEITIGGALSRGERGGSGTAWAINATIWHRSAPASVSSVSKYVTGAEATITADRRGALQLIKLVDDLRTARLTRDTMEQQA